MHKNRSAACAAEQGVICQEYKLNRSVKLILSVIVILFLTGVAFFYVPVSHDAKFQNSENITILIYENGAVKKEIVFPPNSRGHKTLNEWLAINKSEWNHDLNSYAPLVYITSKNISVKLNNGFSVLNYAQFSKDRHTQIIKNMDNRLLISELITNGI